MTDIEKIKLLTRERDCPFFESDEIDLYLQMNDGDVEATIYQCLVIKAEDSSISVSGLSTQDTSSYFRRLASQYKPSNSGILR